MKEDKIVMSQKELQRVQVLDEVEHGFLRLVDGADLMGVSYRQAKRLIASYRRKGAAGLCHGNRGRHPPNQVPPSRREEVVGFLPNGVVVRKSTTSVVPASRCPVR